jgi:hypothetical protein
MRPRSSIAWAVTGTRLRKLTTNRVELEELLLSIEQEDEDGYEDEYEDDTFSLILSVRKARNVTGQAER